MKNNKTSSENSNLQCEIDRLVDGELDSQAERDLLAKLDHVPDGWRICALTFVENRVLQRELVGFIAPEKQKAICATNSTSGMVTVSLNASNDIHIVRSLRTNQWLSIAAAIAIAFLIGMFVPTLQSVTQKGLVPVTQGPATNQYGSSVDPKTPDVAMNTNQSKSDPLLSPMPKGMQLQMVDNKGKYPTQTVNLPLMQLNKWDASVMTALEKWNAEQPLPKELVQEAEFNGQQIQKESMLMPVKMTDGTEVIVPINRVHFEPQEKVNWQ